MNSAPVDNEKIYVKIIVPDIDIERTFEFVPSTLVYAVKEATIKSITRPLNDPFNYGIFWPGCYGKEGKFLTEERPLFDYPLQKPLCLLELRYKRRNYSAMSISSAKLKKVQSKKKLKTFLDSIRDGDMAKVDKLLKKGLDPNFQCSSTGETPLSLSTKRETPRDLIMALVNGGAHVDFRCKDGMTALHKAAVNGNYEAICNLLDLGLSPNCFDEKGLTPLYYCVLHDAPHECTARLLYDHGILGMEDSAGLQEIHQACRLGRSQHLEHLMLYGRDLNVVTRNGNSPLHICAIANQEGCARLLLFRGASRFVRNNSGETPFECAMNKGSHSVAQAIATFNDKDVVLYRSSPKLNPLRQRSDSRPEDTIDSRKSMSLNESISTKPARLSSGEKLTMNKVMVDEYSVSQRNSKNMSSITSMASLNSRNRPSDMDLYKYLDSDMTNTPRIVVLQKSSRGFGFVIPVSPPTTSTATTTQISIDKPSIHYFCDIDKDSPAGKAGLKVGDFILDINNTRVASAPHDEVTRLIRQSGDTLAMKVLTIDQERKIITDLDETLAQFEPDYTASISRVSLPRAQVSPQNNPFNQARLSQQMTHEDFNNTSVSRKSTAGIPPKCPPRRDSEITYQMLPSASAAIMANQTNIKDRRPVSYFERPKYVEPPPDYSDSDEEKELSLKSGQYQRPEQIPTLRPVANDNNSVQIRSTSNHPQTQNVIQRHKSEYITTTTAATTATSSSSLLAKPETQKSLKDELNEMIALRRERLAVGQVVVDEMEETTTPQQQQHRSSSNEINKTNEKPPSTFSSQAELLRRATLVSKTNNNNNNNNDNNTVSSQF